MKMNARCLREKKTDHHFYLYYFIESLVNFGILFIPKFVFAGFLLLLALVFSLSSLWGWREGSRCF